MRNVLLTIEYDGSEFHGWQEQPGLRTVQGVLQDALSQVIGQSIKVNGTSRTDAGVHALGQCCNFAGDFTIPTENLVKATNNILSGGRTSAGTKPGDLRIVSAEEKPEEFHARFDCKGKTYRYVFNLGAPNIFRRNHCYYVDLPRSAATDANTNDSGLDIAAMELAAEHIIGTHDFACFQAAGSTPKETTVRTIYKLNITPAGWGQPCDVAQPYSATQLCDGAQPYSAMQPGDVIIEVTGDGFLYNMVRIIAGTLIEVGLGKRTPESVRDAIEAKDRTLAGHTAPPEGLYLAEIYFDDLD